MRISLKIVPVLLLLVAGCSRSGVPAKTTDIVSDDDRAKYEYFFVEGLRNKLIGSPADAVRLFEECIKIDPQQAGAYYQVGQILYIIGDLKGAKPYGKKALELEKNVWHFMLAANIHYQSGNPDSSLLIYREAAAIFPDNDEIRFSLGSLNYETGNFAEAAEIFGYFDRKYGLAGSSAIPLVKSLIKLGEYERAFSKLTALIEENPGESIFLAELAELFRITGEPEKASDIYQNLLKEGNSNIETLLSVVDYFRAENDNENIFNVLNIAALSESLTIEEKVRLYASQIENRDFIRNYPKELEMSVMILEAAHSDNPVVKLLRPEILYLNGNSEEASKLYRDYIARWPENYYAWEKLLAIVAGQGVFEELYSLSTQAVRRFNTAIYPRLINAVSAVEVGLYDDALEQLVRLRRLINDNEDLALQILSIEADALYRKGLFDEAFGKYDEAIMINGNDHMILNNYAYFLAERGIRLRDAGKMIRRVIEEEDSNNTYNDTYAWVLFKQGKLRRAEKVMRQIITSDDNNDAEYYEHYGFILKSLRRCEQAIISWNKAIELDSRKGDLQKEIENCMRR